MEWRYQDLRSDRLFSTIDRALAEYGEEDSNFEDAILDDVYIVGSFGSDSFEPRKSDLDLCVIVSGVEGSGVLMGFDTFLREEYQSELQRAAGLPVTEVDVGVYDTTDYIEDSVAFSCLDNRKVNIAQKSD